MLSQNVTKRVETTVGKISFALAVIAGALVAVMALHVSADIASRNLLNSPLPGTLEFTNFWWLPSIVFLGLPWVENVKGHIRVSLIIDKLEDKLRSTFNVVAQAVGILIVVVTLYLASISFLSSAEIGEFAPGAVPIPIWLAKAVMTIGLAQFLVQSIVNLFLGEAPKNEASVEDMEVR